MKTTWADRKKSKAPKAIGASITDVVNIGELEPGKKLPLVVTPKLAGLDLTELVHNNMEWVEKTLLEHGGILFRGFQVDTQEAFNDFVSKNCPELLNYKEGATPRKQLTDKVYTSTEFPNTHHIALHNELSYVTTWPVKIFFCSVDPADEGGQTPIADVRGVYNRIDPKVRQKFEEKGWMLIRNYEEGFGMPWQYVFHADTQEQVEEYCRTHKMEHQWLDNDRLRTRQVRPATIKHPVTQEDLWFNHIAFWHWSSLDPVARQMLIEEFGPEGLPYNTFYGDGTEIEEEVAAELRRAYDEETVAFLWEKGDLMMLDNMLVAHGRFPYEGTRKTLVAMGEPFTRTDI